MDTTKKNPPQIHRMEGELMLCDPAKADHTRPIEEWRIEKMEEELQQGFDILRKYKLAATFFGSARDTMEPKIYADAEELAARLAKSNFAVMTGGGGGIMEAVNRGAFNAGGQSVGLNIKLPSEQHENKYLTEEMTFNYFFTRRVMLSFAAEVYIFFPGGFGTLDEFFEIVTLIQTGKIKRIPVIVYGKDFWDPLVDFVRKTMLDKRQTINEADLELFTIVDSVDDAYDKILNLVNC